MDSAQDYVISSFAENQVASFLHDQPKGEKVKTALHLPLVWIFPRVESGSFIQIDPRSQLARLQLL